jgi:hypothetical protein
MKLQGYEGRDLIHPCMTITTITKKLCQNHNLVQRLHNILHIMFLPDRPGKCLFSLELVSPFAIDPGDSSY